MYEEAKHGIKLDIQEPVGIAVDRNDRIYIAGDEAIVVFDDKGRRQLQLSLAASPRSLAVAEDGTIYVAMNDHVEVYSPQGKRLADWSSPGDKTTLTSIAICKTDVFVADAGNRVVLHYDRTGKLIGRIGKRDLDRNVPGFVVPSPYFDLAVAADGLLRVVNPGRHRIEAYTFGGDLEFFWGKFGTAIEGFSGCCNPVNFALLPDGGFVTCEKGLTRVKVYDVDGNFVGVVAGPEMFDKHDTICAKGDASSCNKGGLDVAVDSQARVLVMDPLTAEVRIFTRVSEEQNSVETER